MADEDGDKVEKVKSGGGLTKIIAGVFTAIVVPVVVAVSIKHFSPKDDKPAADSPPSTPAAAITPKDPGPKDPGPKDPVTHLVAAGPEAWAAYEQSGPVFARTKDPKVIDKLFHFTPGSIQIPGTKLGALVSDEAFENYQLIVEYKWGAAPPPPKDPTPVPKDKKPVPPKVPPRRASLIIHGQDTTAQTTWMPGIRCLIQEGTVGGLGLRSDDHKVSVTATVVERELQAKGTTSTRRYYKTDASPKTLTAGTPKGWNNHFYRLGSIPDDDEGIKPDELERAGDWNKLEVVCEGNSIRIKLNDREINACTATSVRLGRIVIMAEGNEIFFRKIDVVPLKKPDDDAAK